MIYLGPYCRDRAIQSDPMESGRVNQCAIPGAIVVSARNSSGLSFVPRFCNFVHFSSFVR